MLTDVDLDLAPGEIATLTGGNGSGKSTLLRLLVGLSRPTSGTIAGRPAVVGYVPERFPSDERMSARSYLRHLGRIRGLGGAEAADRAAELLARLALAGGPDTALRLLSKGNAQKVALAQALLVPPALLVLDEPWSGLDVAAHGELRRMIAEVAEAGGAIMVADHSGAINELTVSAGYRIDGGRLVHRTPEPTTAATLVTLVPPAEPGHLDQPDHLDWLAVDGVRTVTRTGHDGSVALRVDRDRADQLLLDALHKGWSVLGVWRDERLGPSRDKDQGDPR